MATITIKNKDGSVNKKETARLKRNANMLEDMIKKDFMGNIRKKRITEIPRDAVLQGARKLMSIMPGSVGEEGKKQLMLKRIANQVMKSRLQNKASGGRIGRELPKPKAPPGGFKGTFKPKPKPKLTPKLKGVGGKGPKPSVKSVSKSKAPKVGVKPTSPKVPPAIPKKPSPSVQKRKQSKPLTKGASRTMKDFDSLLNKDKAWVGPIIKKRPKPEKMWKPKNKKDIDKYIQPLKKGSKVMYGYKKGGQV
jgi:hypothetical protein